MSFYKDRTHFPLSLTRAFLPGFHHITSGVRTQVRRSYVLISNKVTNTKSITYPDHLIYTFRIK